MNVQRSWFSILPLAILRLNPLAQARNIVMFTVYLCACLSLFDLFVGLFSTHSEPLVFRMAVCALLWLTVLAASLAETYAEQQGKAQASALRAARHDLEAKKLDHEGDIQHFRSIAASQLKNNDVVIVEAGDIIPADGQIIQGIASVDESAITGESAPVIREATSDRDFVTGGTRVLSDFLIIRITSNTGENFLDHMIEMVEGAKRARTPNEIALGVLLAGITIIFIVSCITLVPFSRFSIMQTGVGSAPSLTLLLAFLVCMVPTTIGGLLSAISIAGMNRMMRANVMASSGRSVEAAGDVSILLLDKTGTLTYGNRQPYRFISCDGIEPKRLARAALYASLADDTPEGKSIAHFACRHYRLALPTPDDQTDFSPIPFSAETRTSGSQYKNTMWLKGADDSIIKHVKQHGGYVPTALSHHIKNIARQGGTPLLVAEDNRILGVIHLKDIIKKGIKNRLMALRSMGISSVLVTGDNPLTASAIAAEAGVDDFIAQAAPETKLNYIRQKQAEGHLVAMIGDGTNDAPALAQADVAVAMQTGTQEAKEASTMVDMDSDPAKLIQIVEIGKQLLMTRGALTTFSISTDIAKYFATLPAIFAYTLPALAQLNVMGLSSPTSAILSALVFNVLMILILIPLALKGVPYRLTDPNLILRRNMIVYGGGGLAFPFIGIKLLDMGISALLNIGGGL